MDEVKQRVIKELDDLTIKIVGLVKFKYTEAFSNLSQEMRYLMEEQLRHMMGYADDLRGRLHIWGKTDEELNHDFPKICD